MDKTAHVIDSYNKSAEAYNQKFQAFSLYDDAFDAFLAYLPQGARVLDIACGPGNVAGYMLKKRPDLCWTGMDLSAEMVRLAAENNPQATFLQGDVRSLPAGAYDAAVASFCLPHLEPEEAKHLFARLAALLPRGAYLYLSTMEGEGSRLEDASFSGGATFYYYFYSRAFLEEQLGHKGFSILCRMEKEYPERDGSITTDLLYIAQKG